jgi:RND superfamily putative drug exporter
MSLLGGAAWWLPPWLDRLLPRIDVEGTALRPPPGSSPEPGTAGHRRVAALEGEGR